MLATGNRIEDSVADQSLREALELERLLVATIESDTSSAVTRRRF
jgi:hypothetical protein